MAEIRLKENESLESPLSSVRKSQKQLASASINKAAHIYLESGRFARFLFCFCKRFKCARRTFDGHFSTNCSA